MMKRFFLTAILMIITAAAFGMDFNVDARTDISYISFIKNDAYNSMALSLTPSAVNVYEKLRLKAKEQVDKVKFDFDARLYAYPGKTSFDFTIDSAYFSFENGPFVFYAGKQRIKWGTGYFWNPVDSLQPATPDIYRPTEDMEGIYAIRAEFSNDFIAPSLIIMPKPGIASQDAYKDFDLAIQLYKLVGTCDIFLNYIYDFDRQNAGAAISWDLGIFVLNAQAALKEIFGEKNFNTSFSAGVSETLTDNMLAVVEYYRNNGGMTNADYGVNVLAGVYGQGFGKKDYLAYMVSYTWNEKFSLSITGLHGLDDGTSFIFPAVSYVENSNYDIQLSLLENLSGKGLREGYYSIPVYNTVELRFNAYF